jgi:CPA1 family monovalent cation:H+ antiporter
VSLPETMLDVSLLLALIVVVALATQRTRVPLTVVLTVAGYALAAGGLSPDVGELQGESFEQVVLFVFLPLLVFAAALDLDLRAFVRNLGAILGLAVVAFLVSAALVGVALHLALGVPLVVTLLFGALISATDPVAVVAVFRQVGVPRRLLVLVEGESLLNDGVAIVAASVLLGGALGATTDPLAGAAEFGGVFAGGTVLGLLVGLLAAVTLPWLAALPAVVLTLAAAYGSFLLAEHVLGFSGVVATAAAGMVLAGLAPVRASAAVREMWHATWEVLDYVANAVLFLLIGLALGAVGLLEHLGPVALAVVVVLVARAAAVVPVVWLLERVGRIPRVGRRNEAVLTWGGLRGGVALALALALPEELEDRDLLIALTGGVVIATLLLNATTIGWLVHRLGLDEPSSADRFLLACARLSGASAARERLHALGLDDGGPDGRLRTRAREAEREIAAVDLDEDAQFRVVVGRGLHVERTVYQDLSDAGLLPGPATRRLLHEVDDEIDDLALLGRAHELGQTRVRRTPLDRVLRGTLVRLPVPLGEDERSLAYAEATARRLAARQTIEDLEIFEGVQGVSRKVVEHARETFREWERQAEERLSAFDTDDPAAAEALRQAQVEVLARAEATRALRELTASGLLPPRAAEQPLP